MTIDMKQFYQAFFDEAGELLSEAEHLLLNVDLDHPDQEQINAIFRAAHSIKGGAATFGFNDMTEITHELETLLDRIRKHEMTFLPEHVELFLAAKDILELQLMSYRDGIEIDREPEKKIKAQLRSISQDRTAPVTPTIAVVPDVVSVIPEVVYIEAVAPQTRVYRIALPPTKDDDVENLLTELSILGKASVEILENKQVVFTLETDEEDQSIIAICSFVVDVDDLTITQIDHPALLPESVIDQPAIPVTPDIDQIGIPAIPVVVSGHDDYFGLFEPLDEDHKHPGLASEQNAIVLPHVPEPALVTIPDNKAVDVVSHEDAASEQAKTANERRSSAPESTSIRVGIEKVDQVINLVGELVITQSMIERQVGLLNKIGNEGLFDSLEQLIRNTRDLQQSVMSIRMMPMEYVFSRFPRLVRDLASRLGKRVELVTVGSTTEMDKALIERIIDPLTHLIRNSIDHGIEIPSVRTALGKNETGRISLSAYNRGGNIVIKVSDDGAGLNRKRIVSKARENGLLVSDNMSDKEVWQLIFAPGFSTAAVVTDVSGRGVGMDVVKRNINSMGGTVEIKSAEFFGSEMSISLPLTLAVLEGMSIALGEHIYILPLSLIVETVQPKAEDIKTVTGQGLMIHSRGEYLPIIPLHVLFNQTSLITNPTEGVLVIIEAEGKKAALLVDGLLGQQQVVIKSMETNFKKIKGISAATIMGDGSVALILDIPAVIKLGQSHY
jgi:two-component system chemotaxis sensor kinase CheA